MSPVLATCVSIFFAVSHCLRTTKAQYELYSRLSRLIAFPRLRSPLCEFPGPNWMLEEFPSEGGGDMGSSSYFHHRASEHLSIADARMDRRRLGSCLAGPLLKAVSFAPAIRYANKKTRT